MALTRNEIMDWLRSQPVGAKIAINDDGLTLINVEDSREYLEVGGAPDSSESEVLPGLLTGDDLSIDTDTRGSALGTS